MNRSDEAAATEQRPGPVPRPRRPSGLTLASATTFRDVLLAARDSGKPYAVSVRGVDAEECFVSRVENDFVVLTSVDDGEQVFVRTEDVVGIAVVLAGKDEPSSDIVDT